MKSFCYVIVADQKDENGYIPSMVKRDVSGHFPMRGNGPFSCPWYWGKTFEEAEETCKRANERMGLTEKDVQEIITSSVMKQCEEEHENREIDNEDA
jgi:hypothetical protein